jgi:hypothetical protein
MSFQVGDYVVCRDKNNPERVFGVGAITRISPLNGFIDMVVEEEVGSWSVGTTALGIAPVWFDYYGEDTTELSEWI